LDTEENGRSDHYSESRSYTSVADVTTQEGALVGYFRWRERRSTPRPATVSNMAEGSGMGDRRLRSRIQCERRVGPAPGPLKVAKPQRIQAGEEDISSSTEIVKSVQAVKPLFVQVAGAHPVKQNVISNIIHRPAT
jgi:hypothetical protein